MMIYYTREEREGIRNTIGISPSLSMIHNEEIIMDTKIKTTITTFPTNKEYNEEETKKALCKNVKRAAVGTTVATTAVLTRNIASGYALGCAYNGRSKASSRAMKIAAAADCVAVELALLRPLYAQPSA